MSAMSLDQKMPHGVFTLRSRSANQRGFSIIAAIFLLLLLAGLGALMVTLSTFQNVTSTQDLQGGRAYQAARAGIEWGVYQVMNPENTNPAVSPFNARYVCPVAATTFNNLGGALNVFSVSVQCTQSADFTESGNLIRVYKISSTATLGTLGHANYVERKLDATVSTCRQTTLANC